jgi:DNA-binding transcriptional MerR regulator
VTYSVADVIKATGMKRRTIQFWADKGVIHATRPTQEGGSGVHRSFTRSEVIIACLIHPVSLGWRGDQTRSLGEIKEFASALRHLLRDPVIRREEFDNAIADRGKFYLILTWVFGGGIETAIQMVDGKQKFWFPGVIDRLEEQSGRSEVLYLNEWLRPLRDM